MEEPQEPWVMRKNIGRGKNRRYSVGSGERRLCRVGVLTEGLPHLWAAELEVLGKLRHTQGVLKGVQ